MALPHSAFPPSLPFLSFSSHLSKSPLSTFPTPIFPDTSFPMGKMGDWTDNFQRHHRPLWQDITSWGVGGWYPGAFPGSRQSRRPGNTKDPESSKVMLEGALGWGKRKERLRARKRKAKQQEVQGLRPRALDQTTQVQNPALPLICSVTLNKSLNLSVP